MDERSSSFEFEFLVTIVVSVFIIIGLGFLILNSSLKLLLSPLLSVSTFLMTLYFLLLTLLAGLVSNQSSDLSLAGFFSNELVVVPVSLNQGSSFCLAFLFGDSTVVSVLLNQSSSSGLRLAGFIADGFDTLPLISALLPFFLLLTFGGGVVFSVGSSSISSSSFSSPPVKKLASEPTIVVGFSELPAPAGAEVSLEQNVKKTISR